MSKTFNPFNIYIEKSKGVLLLIIAICGNFIAETLNCRLQKQFTDNRVFKYLIVFLTIYISFTITSKNTVNPFNNLVNSIITFVIFILFTRMTLYPTYISMFIFILIFFINNYLIYLNASKKITSFDKIIINFNLKLLFSMLFIVMIIGNLQYFQEKRKQFGSKFNFINYFFGNYQCEKTEIKKEIKKENKKEIKKENKKEIKKEIKKEMIHN